MNIGALAAVVAANAANAAAASIHGKQASQNQNGHHQTLNHDEALLLKETFTMTVNPNSKFKIMTLTYTDFYHGKPHNPRWEDSVYQNPYRWVIKEIDAPFESLEECIQAAIEHVNPSEFTLIPSKTCINHNTNHGEIIGFTLLANVT